ncbi:hypothetical protein MtrunA17_Chr5g0447051 [Medicago truncatula]|uniref:Uncharacterized protein n=1 Tax=Medicago truncatula TaxID=3880 RepID=A0A072UFE8_MEDTR|nr:hypothetical protein MTR_5g096603 [Medicago truncatula]RHN58060.1 hypothetical protein MtrunA17_Chr5g0447051 [Medicago truncatula]
MCLTYQLGMQIQGRHKLSNSMKLVKCSDNSVSKTDSNGNSMLENHLDDTSEKKDQGPNVGKILEDNEVKDLEMV